MEKVLKKSVKLKVLSRFISGAEIPLYSILFYITLDCQFSLGDILHYVECHFKWT